ncbi:CpaF family protein [Bifidobacterium crudilactis]|jgi:pilus assembly protein CpaF|uniref:Flp pilus assembly complex ATPase component TadA n=1 Tax=Bifidobacterium crudilactis TaxID=327277 RepID=A0A971CXT0_9BIFI|nr:ATPase, T2SS/T4P/T4SS family [Bifidobacterium crudilactis]MCI1868879.1 Flp pilus assembly complex ATPase component TadA [Bifidobacterium crudilactis]MDN5973176.1 Flp pilus assembly complex ATPase component TadA [Bifidobacterium crudilactis]MDN6000792.1 Flp pilus assembly complex ATPase component TadA [Bifidobacterium crudilactis]MDN6209062.1 Flp pilus assembly complex ATPase component TadA [Bifidobacterium crudilactis]MDN6459191.1 Flp pilus assembly complex ATPase component TadA [Bifidobact
MSEESEEDDLIFGPLDEFAHDPKVSDIAVTEQGRVWVDSGDGMKERFARLSFHSPRVVREFAVQLCSQLGHRLDDACPIADVSTPGGIRINAVIAPLVPHGAVISIRFPNRMTPRLDHLAREGMMPEIWASTLKSLVRRRASLLVTGATAAGKTTLLRALLAECDDNDRIITVEETRELGQLPMPNHVSLATRAANVEGAGAIGLDELMRATLRMRPDRVILGECRGAEVVHLLRALNAGHRGGMATIHANSVPGTPARLVSLGLLAGLDAKAMTYLLEGAFDVLIHVHRVSGVRRIAQIGCLHQGDGGQLSGRVLSVWDGGTGVLGGDAWCRFLERWNPEWLSSAPRAGEDGHDR